MSRRPGLGHQYLSRTKDWNKKNDANYVPKGDYKVRYPRYWKDKQFTKEEKEYLNAVSGEAISKRTFSQFQELEKKYGYWKAIDHQRAQIKQKEELIKSKSKNSKL